MGACRNSADCEHTVWVRCSQAAAASTHSVSRQMGCSTSAGTSERDEIIRLSLHAVDSVHIESGTHRTNHGQKNGDRGRHFFYQLSSAAQLLADLRFEELQHLRVQVDIVLGLAVAVTFFLFDHERLGRVARRLERFVHAVHLVNRHAYIITSGV